MSKRMSKRQRREMREKQERALVMARAVLIGLPGFCYASYILPQPFEAISTGEMVFSLLLFVPWLLYMLVRVVPRFVGR